MGICLGVGKWWEAGWEESNGSSGLSGREDDGAGSLRVGIHLARGKLGCTCCNLPIWDGMFTGPVIFTFGKMDSWLGFQ
ncbi:hypothetical protein TB1_024410 [Malus domestica]